jgi:hypothetical protein
MEVSGQLHAPAALSGVRAPGTHWIGGWVRPKAGLEAVVKKINSITEPAGNWTPAIQPVV